jgi:two-component system CheB/CheR fusion protein
MSDELPEGSDVEVLLDYLRRNRGFDFTGYKRTSLTRRIDKRMQEVGIPSYLDYVDYLEVVPEEFTHLFNTILINVTSFFRDPPAWEFLAEEVLPRILAARRPGEPLRLWSAGCASGQEAYTLAMVCG